MPSALAIDRIRGILPVAGLLVASAAWAAEPSQEFDGTLAYFRVQAGYNTIGGLGIGYRGIGYGHTLTDWLELSFRSRFATSANTDLLPGQTVIEATVGPTFNFSFGSGGGSSGGSKGLANDYFISLEAGINYTAVNGIVVPGTFYTTDSVSSTAPALCFEFGKRFQVLPNVSLKPSLAINWTMGEDLMSGASTAHPAVSINPIEISVLF